MFLHNLYETNAAYSSQGPERFILQERRKGRIPCWSFERDPRCSGEQSGTPEGPYVRKSYKTREDDGAEARGAIGINERGKRGGREREHKSKVGEEWKEKDSLWSAVTSEMKIGQLRHESGQGKEQAFVLPFWYLSS